MKRIIAMMLVLLLALASTVSSCAQSGIRKDDKIGVVCTIFPQYDWVRQILGGERDDVELTLLLDNKIDLHSYQPSIEDMVKIADCDLFIFVGGESDGWVDDALLRATNKDRMVLNLLEILGESVKIEEMTEGMEAESLHSMEKETEGHEMDEDTAYDEHVWLSLKNAQRLCAAIADALSTLDSDNAEAYRDNSAAYLEKLSLLDAGYQKMVNTASIKTLLFGDRFPFRYLTDDYGLAYDAAFAGCSAETEASFETIIFLAEKIDTLGLQHILVTESSDKRMAETIIRESKDSNRQILVLDSLQSVTSGDIANGATYFSLMESNLHVLEEALH
ncbi:MAG: metal ABC transporter substrate-binding protein [Clostridiales bacterium]|nr:metal ABC transporter substrate-binding protein [Clostridiales bacterium]